jgi:hypothetical protein
MTMARHRAVVAGCALLVAVGLIAGYLWQRDASGKVVADLQSAPVADMGVTYVTWGGAVVLIVWRDFALT